MRATSPREKANERGKSRKWYQLNDISTRPIQPPPYLEVFRGAAQVARVEGTIEGAERKKVFGKMEESKRKGAGKGSRE